MDHNGEEHLIDFREVSKYFINNHNKYSEKLQENLFLKFETLQKNQFFLDNEIELINKNVIEIENNYKAFYSNGSESNNLNSRKIKKFGLFI